MSMNVPGHYVRRLQEIQLILPNVEEIVSEDSDPPAVGCMCVAMLYRREDVNIWIKPRQAKGWLPRWVQTHGGNMQEGRDELSGQCGTIS